MQRSGRRASSLWGDVMAEVTGPISTLPGAQREVPAGTMCDEHADRPAVARVQGETDSFGSEMHDLCQECLDEHRTSQNSPEAKAGKCDWCKNDATDLAWRRDFEEGTSGPVYRVCGGCRTKQIQAAQEQYGDDDYDDFEDDYDPGEECGRWYDGKLGASCSKAGSEECDFECPYRDRSF